MLGQFICFSVAVSMIVLSIIVRRRVLIVLGYLSAYYYLLYLISLFFEMSIPVLGAMIGIGLISFTALLHFCLPPSAGVSRLYSWDGE